MLAGPFHLDELRLWNVTPLSCFAHSLMLLPIRIVESKRFQQRRSCLRGLIAALHDLFALHVIHRVVFGQRHGNNRIRAGQAAHLILRQHHAHGIFQDAEQGLDVLCFDGRLLQMHGNHDVRAHLPDHIGRQVVQQTSIDKDGRSLMHRGKRPGNRHRCAQRDRKRAISKHVGFSAYQIGGHAAEGNR